MAERIRTELQTIIDHLGQGAPSDDTAIEPIVTADGFLRFSGFVAVV